MTTYLQPEELKSTLSLTGMTFADSDIQAALEAASRGIEKACNRRFTKDTVDQVRTYTPVSAYKVMIDDLISITLLTSDQSGARSFSTTWMADTHYLLEPPNAAADGEPYTRIRLSTRAIQLFPSWYAQSVRVTGKFGWPAVPGPIVTATSVLAAKLLRRTREAPFGIVSVGIDTGAVARIARTDPDISFLIANYVREDILG